jgi:asparagine synthase (glutamine-hydrolysing)
MREPSGGIGCYYARQGHRLILASDAALLADALGQTPDVDLIEVRSQLQYFGYRTERTALAGVIELPPGTCLSLEAGRLSRRIAWSPYPFARHWDRHAEFEAAQREVRRAILTTVAAMARGFRHPIVKLSGGLDSSIVTAGLAAAGAGATCLSLRSGGADLDETRYARAVAERCGSPIAVETLDPENVVLAHSAASHLPRPVARLFAQADDALAVALARRIGGDAFFSGGGGDNVLWYFPTAAPALDRLRRDGLLGSWQTLGDLGRMTGVGRLKATRIALRKLVQRHAQDWPHHLGFLSPDARTLAEPGWHPWLPPPSGTTPGVRAYVRALIQMQDHFEHGARRAFGPILTPLLAQPVVEQCLATPSWLWCRGGRDRALARAAFADLLPDTVLARRTKGGFDGFVTRILNRSRAEVRTMLLEGLLADKGLLDRAAIEQALTGEAPIADEAASRLLRLAAVEAWLQSWRARR